MATILYDMMSAMHVRRFWVSWIVFAAVIALLPFSFHAERRLETATRVEEQAARLGALSRASGEELERRLEAILA